LKGNIVSRNTGYPPCRRLQPQKGLAAAPWITLRNIDEEIAYGIQTLNCPPKRVTPKGTITVSADKSVSGSITTSGIDAKAAHIHEGERGKNGPVIIPLNKTADNMWSVPEGAKLTNAQYASYMAGNLYVNVHTAANPGGEIRAQLTLPVKRSDRAGY
jgi:hypothetical protein